MGKQQKMSHLKSIRQKGGIQISFSSQNGDDEAEKKSDVSVTMPHLLPLVDFNMHINAGTELVLG